MKDEETKLLCPLTFNQSMEEFDEIDLKCIEEECAWWSKYHEACAIHTINEIPQHLFKIFTALNHDSR